MKNFGFTAENVVATAKAALAGKKRNPVAGFARIRMFAEIDARNSGESRYDSREVRLEPVAEPAAEVVHLVGPLLGDLPLCLGQGDFVDVPWTRLHPAGHRHPGARPDGIAMKAEGFTVAGSGCS